MTLADPLRTHQPIGVSVVRDKNGWEGFRAPSSAALLWEREMPLDVTTWLATLAPGALPNGRIVLQANAVADAVHQLCEAAGTPESQPRAWLIGDIAKLAQCFANLMNVAYVRLRLQTVTTNACRKFHLDAVTGRLVCTYLGTGTQYGTSVDGAEPERIYTVPTGVPILLRGSLWPPQADIGLRHRSPPIEGTGETRLVLVLDPVLDLENDNDP